MQLVSTIDSYDHRKDRLRPVHERRDGMDIRIAHNNLPALMEGSTGTDAWILCATCNKPITSLEDGVAVYGAPYPLPSNSSVTFVHQGRCDNRASYSSMRLNGFLRWLLETDAAEPSDPASEA